MRRAFVHVRPHGVARSGAAARGAVWGAKEARGAGSAAGEVFGDLEEKFAVFGGEGADGCEELALQVVQVVGGGCGVHGFFAGGEPFGADAEGAGDVKDACAGDASGHPAIDCLAADMDAAGELGLCPSEHAERLHESLSGGVHGARLLRTVRRAIRNILTRYAKRIHCRPYAYGCVQEGRMRLLFALGEAADDAEQEIPVFGGQGAQRVKDFFFGLVQVIGGGCRAHGFFAGGEPFGANAEDAGDLDEVFGARPAAGAELELADGGLGDPYAAGEFSGADAGFFHSAFKAVAEGHGASMAMGAIGMLISIIRMPMIAHACAAVRVDAFEASGVIAATHAETKGGARW